MVIYSIEYVDPGRLLSFSFQTNMTHQISRWTMRHGIHALRSCDRNKMLTPVQSAHDRLANARFLHMFHFGAQLATYWRHTLCKHTAGLKLLHWLTIRKTTCVNHLNCRSQESAMVMSLSRKRNACMRNDHLSRHSFRLRHARVPAFPA